MVPRNINQYQVPGYVTEKEGEDDNKWDGEKKKRKKVRAHVGCPK